MNRMIVLPARPHVVYTWAVSYVSIVICHTSGSQGETEWTDFKHPIQQELLLPKSPEDFLSLSFWHPIKWDIGLMSFTPGHKEPSFSLLQHKWFGLKAWTYIKQLCSDINVAQVYLPQCVLWPD